MRTAPTEHLRTKVPGEDPGDRAERVDAAVVPPLRGARADVHLPQLAGGSEGVEEASAFREPVWKDVEGGRPSVKSRVCRGSGASLDVLTS